jgi:hypothetical protein
MATSQVYGVRETLAEIKNIDKALYFQCVKDIKDAAKPLAGALVMEFSNGSPMSGMEHRGRTAWKTPKVMTKFGGRKDKTADSWGLVKIIVSGAAAQMTDLAGRSYSGEKTRSYGWKNTKRTHTVNGQGAAMIRNLGGKPSRTIWPTTEAFMPMTNRAILKAIEEVSAIVNKNLVLRQK